MKIGIGVTAATNVLWKGSKYFPVYNGESGDTVFFANYHQTTVAQDKNWLIKKLYDANCDYIAIFDDDCFPINPGWSSFLIDASLKTGVQHFVLCNEKHNVKMGYMDDICDLYSTGTGCMIFLTRKVIDTVGYINNAYRKYGYEHAAYSLRIAKAQLTPAWYVSVNGWEKYIYSWDLQKEEAEKHGYVKVQNMSEDEKQKYIAENAEIFNKEQDSDQLYYPYEI